MGAQCPNCEFEQDVPANETLMYCTFCEAKLRIGKSLGGKPDLSVTAKGRTIKEIREELMPALEKKLEDTQKAIEYLMSETKAYEKADTGNKELASVRREEYELVNLRLHDLTDEINLKKSFLEKK